MRNAARQILDRLLEHLEDGAHGLEAVHQADAAVGDEEGSRHADVCADVEHHVAGGQVDAMAKVGPVSRDLRDLEPKLGRVAVAHYLAQRSDSGLRFGIAHAAPRARVTPAPPWPPRA